MQRIGRGNCGVETIEQKIFGMFLRLHPLLVLGMLIG
jgi:hypothetical protein